MHATSRTLDLDACQLDHDYFTAILGVPSSLCVSWTSGSAPRPTYASTLLRLYRNANEKIKLQVAELALKATYNCEKTFRHDNFVDLLAETGAGVHLELLTGADQATTGLWIAGYERPPLYVWSILTLFATLSCDERNEMIVLMANGNFEPSIGKVHRTIAIGRESAAETHMQDFLRFKRSYDDKIH